MGKRLDKLKAIFKRKPKVEEPTIVLENGDVQEVKSTGPGDDVQVNVNVQPPPPDRGAEFVPPLESYGPPAKPTFRASRRGRKKWVRRGTELLDTSPPQSPAPTKPTRAQTAQAAQGGLVINNYMVEPEDREERRGKGGRGGGVSDVVGIGQAIGGSIEATAAASASMYGKMADVGIASLRTQPDLIGKYDKAFIKYHKRIGKRDYVTADISLMDFFALAAWWETLTLGEASAKAGTTSTTRYMYNLWNAVETGNLPMGYQGTYGGSAGVGGNPAPVIINNAGQSSSEPGAPQDIISQTMRWLKMIP